MLGAVTSPAAFAANEREGRVAQCPWAQECREVPTWHHCAWECKHTHGKPALPESALAQRLGWPEWKEEKGQRGRGQKGAVGRGTTEARGHWDFTALNWLKEVAEEIWERRYHKNPKERRQRIKEEAERRMKEAEYKEETEEEAEKEEEANNNQGWLDAEKDSESEEDEESLDSE